MLLTDKSYLLPASSLIWGVSFSTARYLSECNNPSAVTECNPKPPGCPQNQAVPPGISCSENLNIPSIKNNLEAVLKGLSPLYPPSQSKVLGKGLVPQRPMVRGAQQRRCTPPGIPQAGVTLRRRHTGYQAKEELPSGR